LLEKWLIIWQMTVYCGNQMAMWIMEKRTSLGLAAALALMVIWGCAPKSAPTLAAGVALQPGRYLTSVYRAPDFQAARTVYALEDFPVQAAQGVEPEVFQARLQEELSRGFRANGLRLDPQGGAVLRGAVQDVEIRGVKLRFLTGRITGYLTVEGTIARNGEILFAFQDRIGLSSPLNPGPAAPREKELLLDEAIRTFTIHLLNEMLL
jgi:hypothetical protein